MRAPSILATEHSTAPSTFLLLIVGVAAGLFSGVLGVGGGIVMVPLLVGALHFDQHRAHATSLAAIVLIAVAGTLRFAAAGEVDWGLGLALGAGGAVGSTLGANWMNRLSATALRYIFGVVMILAGLRMSLGGDPGLGEAPGDLVAVALGIGVGLVAGMASGVGGIGGGVILVPAMVLVLGLPQHAAEGTSLLAILFAAVAGTRVNSRNGWVDLRQATLIGLGGMIAAAAGASIALALSGAHLARAFGVFVVLAGVRMLYQGYRGEKVS